MKHYLLLLLCLVCSQDIFGQRIMAYDLQPGYANSVPLRLTPFSGRLWFMAFDTARGYELWSTDTSVQPRFEFDINPGVKTGIPGGAISNGYAKQNQPFPMQMAVVKNADGADIALYFIGNDNSVSPTAFTLFKYDLSLSAPIPVVTDFDAKTNAVNDVVAIGEKLYFPVRSDNPAKAGLYEYNHAADTCQIVYVSQRDLPRYLKNYKGKLIFLDRNYLLRIDPVTHKLDTLASSPHSASSYNNVTVVYDRVYFVSDALYEIDDVLGTSKIAKFCYNGSLRSSAHTYPFDNVIGGFRNRVYFPCPSKTNAQNGLCRLCEYLPASKVVREASSAINPHSLTVSGDMLYFSAYDSTNGYELWANNGPTIAMLHDFNTLGHGCLTSVTGFKEHVFFTGVDTFAAGIELIEYVYGKPPSTSISSTSFHADVHIYPNPATNTCNVDINLQEAQTLSLQVYNTMGQQVHEIPAQQYAAGENKLTLPLEALATGVYTIQLRSDKNEMLYSGRIVKQ